MCRLTWRYQIYDPVRRVLVLDETTGSTCEEDGVDLKPKKKRKKGRRNQICEGRRRKVGGESVLLAPREELPSSRHLVLIFQS